LATHIKKEKVIKYKRVVISHRRILEVLKNIMPFIPYVKFHSHPVLSIDEAAAVLKSMKG